MTEPTPAPEGADLTQDTPGVPQPEPETDRQTTLDAAATPSNTPVGDPSVGERADPTLRSHGPR